MSMIDFETKSIRLGATATLTVKGVDNEATFLLNGHVIYHKSYHHDPPLNDLVDLTKQLTAGKNYLDVELLNWSSNRDNPWHIAYEVTVDGASLIKVDMRSDGSAAEGAAYRNQHELQVS